MQFGCTACGAAHQAAGHHAEGATGAAGGDRRLRPGPLQAISRRAILGNRQPALSQRPLPLTWTMAARARGCYLFGDCPCPTARARTRGGAVMVRSCRPEMAVSAAHRRPSTGCRRLGPGNELPAPTPPAAPIACSQSFPLLQLLREVTRHWQHQAWTAFAPNTQVFS